MEDKWREPIPGDGVHRVSIDEREHTAIEGVLNVESFDDREIILETELGILTIRGEDLHIAKLDLDEGQFAVNGLVWSLEYSAVGQRGVKGKGKGLLDRLFR